MSRISSFIKYAKRELPLIVHANSINARYLDIPAKKNRVNVFEYHPERFYRKRLYLGQPYNLGDSLGEVIIRFLLDKKSIDINKPVSKTKHLYCVGTNIQGAYQSATIWGSGIFPPRNKKEAFLQKHCGRKLDIRAVRGPLTRDQVLKYGHKCPEVYGDPAILMPMIYNPVVPKLRNRLVIPQFFNEVEFREAHPNEHMISMNTNDYESVIREILASEIVYTSSLHGIILAESYGVPAVFFRGLAKDRDFKFLDYYYSTGRNSIELSESFEEALGTAVPALPNLSKQKADLLRSFPYDLWEPES